MFVQLMDSSVRCLAHHHDSRRLSYREGFSGSSSPRLFVLQCNDQLLNIANLTGVTVPQSRRQDNSLVGLKFQHDGAQLIAFIAVSSSSVIVCNIVAASLCLPSCACPPAPPSPSPCLAHPWPTCGPCTRMPQLQVLL
jgi:hypothetical protein